MDVLGADVRPRRGQGWVHLAIAVFLAEGDPAALREALVAYGCEAAALDDGLSRRLLAWTLLHRFGDVAAFLDLMPTPDAPTMGALATSWFGTTPPA